MGPIYIRSLSHWQKNATLFAQSSIPLEEILVLSPAQFLTNFTSSLRIYTGMAQFIRKFTRQELFYKVCMKVSMSTLNWPIRIINSASTTYLINNLLGTVETLVFLGRKGRSCIEVNNICYAGLETSHPPSSRYIPKDGHAKYCFTTRKKNYFSSNL